VRAVEVAGITRRDDFYWTLHAVFVTRHEHDVIFEAAFAAFWKSRNLLDKMMEILSPVAADTKRAAEKPKAGAQRIAEAMRAPQRTSERERPLIEIDASLTASDKEILQTKDFEQMTAAEIRKAKAALRALVMPLDKVRVRRHRSSNVAHVLDPRRTMRASLRGGGDMIAMRWRTRARRPPPIVAIADISGSMADYTRMFLHFLHALGGRRRVETFLFGTRLTYVTRQLRYRDPDEALAACTEVVSDWSGGTRIASALRAFNRQWSRRVMAGGPIVLLMTDGLERDIGVDLEREIDRLHRSCRRLIWLYPLLRFDGFEAKAQGIRTMLPHVDELRSIHSLKSVADLAATLAEEQKAGEKDRILATLRAA
jgi:uncharacterized protein with von Willebrand factor type A (vWA) domain